MTMHDDNPRPPRFDTARRDRAVDVALAVGVASGLALLLVAALIGTAVIRADAIGAEPPASLCFGSAMLLAGFACAQGAGQ